MSGWNQRASDAEVFLVPEQVVGIVSVKSETEQGRHGAQSDVALFPRQPETERGLSLVLSHADDTGVGNRGRIRTRARIGERETRNLETPRQPWEVVLLLLIGPIVEQELTRSQ